MNDACLLINLMASGGWGGDGSSLFWLFMLEFSINLLLHIVCDEASTSVVSFHIGSLFDSCRAGSRKHYA